MSDKSGLFLALGTFVLGYAFSFSSDYLRSKSAKADRADERDFRQFDREALQRSQTEERRAVQAAKHLENQLMWAVELQDVLSDFMRTFGEIEHSDIMAIRDSGLERTRVPLLSDELDQRANVLQRRAIVLASRIDAEQVRNGVGELMGLYSRYQFKAEVNTAQITERADPLAQSFAINIQVLGDRLRKLGAEGE